MLPKIDEVQCAQWLLRLQNIVLVWRSSWQLLSPTLICSLVFILYSHSWQQSYWISLCNCCFQKNAHDNYYINSWIIQSSHLISISCVRNWRRTWRRAARMWQGLKIWPSEKPEKGDSFWLWKQEAGEKLEAWVYNSGFKGRGSRTWATGQQGNRGTQWKWVAMTTQKWRIECERVSEPSVVADNTGLWTSVCLDWNAGSAGLE